jgi:hypothetical protein
VIYYPKHFTAQELVDPDTFAKFNLDSLRYFRPELLQLLDWIREQYPTTTSRSLTVNDWSHGGSRKWRGLRNPACPEYKPHSGHTVGAAVDFSAAGCSPEELRQWLLAEHKRCREGHYLLKDSPILLLRRVEVGTPTWVHVDVLEHDAPGVWQVNP